MLIFKPQDYELFNETIYLGCTAVLLRFEEIL